MALVRVVAVKALEEKRKDNMKLKLSQNSV